MFHLGFTVTLLNLDRCCLGAAVNLPRTVPKPHNHNLQARPMMKRWRAPCRIRSSQLRPIHNRESSRIMVLVTFLLKHCSPCSVNIQVCMCNYESQLAGSLLSANEVSIRGSGGRACQREPFCGYYLQRRVSRLVVFPCYVPGGNSVTFGLDSPLVRLWEGYE